MHPYAVYTVSVEMVYPSFRTKRLNYRLYLCYAIGGFMIVCIIMEYRSNKSGPGTQHAMACPEVTVLPLADHISRQQTETEEKVFIGYNDSVGTVSKTFTSLRYNTEENPLKENKHWKTFEKALNEYKIFHRMKLLELKSSTKHETVKTLTWACTRNLCSGIGDQLLRIQYFLLLAMMSGRLFTIYWDQQLQQMTRYIVPNEIDWTYFNRSKGMCDDKQECSHIVFRPTSIWGFGWNTQEFSEIGQALFSDEKHITVSGNVIIDIMMVGNASVKQGEQIENGFMKLGAKQLLLEKSNDTVYLDSRPFWYTMLHRLGIHHLMEIPETNNGRMQPTNSWLYVSHMLFTYLFGFSQTLISKVEEYQKSLGLYHKNYSVIHLRTGFLGTNDEESIITRYRFNGWKVFTDPKHWRCIIQHAIYLRDQTMGSNASIYLSTDSNLVKNMVSKEFGDKHIVFGDIMLAHSKSEHKGCESGSSLATWLDFFMLGNAQLMVHPKSSFSISASFLKPIPHSFHSWIMNDYDRGCLASYIAGNTNCICRSTLNLLLQ